MPDAPESMWWMVTFPAMSLSKPRRCSPTLSVRLSLPCWASCRIATALNGLPAELSVNAMPSWLRTPLSRSAIP